MTSPVHAPNAGLVTMIAGAALIAGCTTRTAGQPAGAPSPSAATEPDLDVSPEAASAEQHDDLGMLYLDCTGGATANFLYAVHPKPLELVVHPEDPTTPAPDGWLHAGWERVETAGLPDTLLIDDRTCEPSCAEGGVNTYTLRWNATFEWWEATSCHRPDLVDVPFDDPVNASATPVLGFGYCQ